MIGISSQPNKFAQYLLVALNASPLKESVEMPNTLMLYKLI